MMKRLLLWFRTNASIRKKLVISFSLLVCIPILVLGIFSFTQARSNILHQTSYTVKSNLARLSSELETRLQKEVDDTKYLAYNLNFRESLEIASTNPVRLAQQLNDNVEPVIWYFVTSDSYISNINIYSPNVAHAIGPFLKPDQAFAQEEWYLVQQKNYNTIWTFEDERLFSSRTILDIGTSSQMIGVLRTEYFLNILSEPIDSMKYMDNGVMVLDAAGKVVYQKATGNDALDTLMKKYTQGEVETQELLTQMFFEEGQLPAANWRVCYYVDKEAVTKQLTPIIRSTLLAVALCMALILILISWLSKEISNRIMALKTASEQVADGNFDMVQFSVDTDEIGVVMNSFALMSCQLQEMIKRVYQMEIDKKTSELKALQAMINPHFLYNCLSSLKWRAIYKEDEEMAQIAGLIAKFYRTSLNNGKQITTVRNELENIRAYIELQQIMHENSFDAFFELEEEHLDGSMLNFLLQPIVENAILHGLDYYEGASGKGQLIIRFSMKNDSLVFCILNNGTEIDLEQIGGILRRPGKGYGIYNIQQRIALYYGKESGIEAGINENGFTYFTIKLKQRVEDLLKN